MTGQEGFMVAGGVLIVAYLASVVHRVIRDWPWKNQPREKQKPLKWTRVGRSACGGEDGAVPPENWIEAGWDEAQLRDRGLIE